MALVNETPSSILVLRAAYLSLSGGVVLLDQVTKAMVSRKIPLHTSIPVIPGLFDLTHVQNTGAAFGLFASMESPLKGILLSAVALLVLLGVLGYAWTSSPRWARLQLGLASILGGAVGNLIDRLSAGSVTDFLDFYVGTHRWPAFNVADSAITVGVLLLALDLWRRPGEAPASERPAEAQ